MASDSPVAAPPAHLEPLPGNRSWTGSGALPADQALDDHVALSEVESVHVAAGGTAGPGGPVAVAGTDPATSAVFPDSGPPGFTWYVPEFRFVAPTPGAATVDSPFRYSFVVTGHDDDGGAVLDATVTMSVDAVLSDATRALIPDPDRGIPVPMRDMRFSLALPTRDHTSGELVTTRVAGTVLQASAGRYDISFALHGSLANAAYGSLSRTGYQSVPARLVTEFSFDCAGHPDPVPGTHGAPSIATVNATVETFPTQVLEAPVPMLVQFWATWCGPCKMLSPVLADLVAEQAGRIGLARVDIDAESALAAAHNVMAIPTTILFSHGAEMRRIVGAKPKAALLAEIADVLTTTASVARTQSVDLLVPCSLHGELYVDATDPDHPVAVGCQDPGTLGDRPAQLYRPLDELGTDDYRVFASVIRFGAYLVLPHRYRVGRAAPGHPGVAEWSPLMRWIQELDATHDTALPCRLLANLQPDIPPAAMASLTARLAELTPNPTVLLPTTFGSGVTSFNATVWNTTHPVTSTLSGDTVQITVDVPFNEAVVLNRMLTSPAPEDVLVGNANYVLGDGTTLAQVELHLDLGRLTGPWPDGPVLAEPTAPGTITVTSHAESPARVSQLRQGPPGTGVLADTPGLSVPPGGSVTVAVDATLAPGARPVAAYTLDEASAVAIDQERIYIEDLHTTITLVNDLEMARNGITGAEVSLRLDDHPDALTVTLTPEEPLYEVDLVQPIVADRQNTTNALHVTAVVHVQGGPDRGGDHLADLGAGSLIRLSTVLAGG